MARNTQQLDQPYTSRPRKLNKHAPPRFFFVSVGICEIYILFLLLGTVSLCCVPSHDIITSPLFTMMQSSREVKPAPPSGGRGPGAAARGFHGDAAVSSGRIARERRRDVGHFPLFHRNSGNGQRRERKGGCRASRRHECTDTGGSSLGSTTQMQ